MTKKKKPYVLQKQLGPGKFTRWSSVGMATHKIGCCDCGLIHEYQYRIAFISDYRKGLARVLGILRRGGGIVVQHRVRRLERATAAMRRAKRYAKVKAALG